MKPKISTTKMSSKGQVVIPLEIREALGFEENDHFIVVAKEGRVILRRVTHELADVAEELLREDE